MTDPFTVAIVLIAFLAFGGLSMGLAMIWLGYSLWAERRANKAPDAGVGTGTPGLQPV